MSKKKPNLDSLFEAAIAIESPEERAAFLQEACGDWRRRMDDPLEVFVTGGGRHNVAVLRALTTHLREAEVRGMEDAGVSADAKEAVDFAWLGWRALRGIPSDTPSLTGAQRPLVLGSLHPAGGSG